MTGFKLLKNLTALILTVLLLVSSVEGSLATSLPATKANGLAFLPAQQGAGQEPGPELAAADTVQLFWHEAVGGPTGLGANSITVDSLGLSFVAAQDVTQIAQTFLQAYSASLQIASGEAYKWQPMQTQVDELGNSHVTLQQLYNDLPIFTSRVIVHISKDNETVTAANGEYLSAIEVSTQPSLSVEEAYKAANNKLFFGDSTLAESEPLIFNPALLDVGASANHLAYRLVLNKLDGSDSQTVFVDAHTGKLLLNYTNLYESRNRDIRDLAGTVTLPGSQCYTETGPVGSPSTDCVNAFNFSGDTYNYYSNTFSRDSFNNAGATMRASVRYGTTANAFWNGSQTAFGPGFATKDVVAHEWTHAVTQYTAGLVYSNQSGALNESMSDIFGAMVDRDDWLMGEDTPIGTLRSLANPTLYGDPGKVSDTQFYCGTSDNGGVHTNSGVPNHTAYLISDGGVYNGRTITGVGRGPTERIFYRALTVYLTSGSNFSNAYNALISAATDLYGAGSATTTSVTTAAQATELNQPVCSSGNGIPDAYEDDDTYTQAKPLSVNNAAQVHNFHDASDNDWVRFAATAGTNYVIETLNLQSRSDTFLYLYSTNGLTILLTDDDSGAGLGSRIAWTPTTSGNYYARVRHYSGLTYGANTGYNLQITSATGAPGPDAYEIDDTFTQARAITINGAAQTHNFHDAGDNDWARFSAVASTPYVIETFNLGSRSDTYLYLYGPDGNTLIASNDDNSGLASRIAWTASTSGNYYLRVRHYNSGVFGANTNYDVRVTSSSSNNPDAYEVDNTPAQAKPITVNGSVQTHNFHVANDQDWAIFPATGGLAYTIETLNLGNRSDTYLYLYGSNGTTLIASNDDGGGGLASRITWTASASGNYYLRVRHYNSTVFGTGTNYNLRVTSSAVGADAYEPDGSAAQASTIAVNGSTQLHNFHVAGDNDWSRFSATAGVSYVIETFNLGIGSDTYLYLYGTNGSTILVVNDDSGGTLASRIEWVAPASGTYYARVRHYSPSAFGPNTSYNLRVTSTGGGGDVYEPDNTYLQARTITVDGNAQTNHNFHIAGDNDWARFSAVAGNNYIIETLNLGSQSDTILYLYSTNGTTLLASNDDSGGTLASRIVWSAPASGNYYIRVQHYFSSLYGPNTRYDLRVIGTTDLYEPDNSPAQARTITPNGARQIHGFYAAGDQDWVRFSVAANTTCILETSNLGSVSDTVLFLYSTNGITLLASNDDGGVGFGSRIVYTFASAGTYYAQARHYSSAIFGPNTNYDLAIGCGSSIDTYEPDNAFTQARPITVNGSSQANHTSHVAGDNDWISFSATNGLSYAIETLNLGINGDTILYLYSTNGTTLLRSDDDSGVGLASRILWTAPANGVYYIRVFHYNPALFGPDTRYDLRVITSATLAATAATVEFTADSARVGQEVEAIVSIRQAISAIKVEALAKSAYLNLVEVMPLSIDAQSLGETVTADPDRWQLTDEDDGQLSVWYSGKIDWDGKADYPVLRLRWQLTAPLPAAKLAIPFSLTTIDQNGQATTEMVEPAIVMVGNEPKIDQVQPTTFSNITNTVIFVQGSNFDGTAKLYLFDGAQEIQLIDITYNSDSGGVLATVPAGTKPGTYKLRLVNPDEGSTQYDTDIIITASAPAGSFIYLPMIVK